MLTSAEEQLHHRVAALETRLEALTTSVQGAFDQVAGVLTPLAVATRAAPWMDDPPFGPMHEPGVGLVYGYSGVDGSRTARDGYRGFEDIFRGSEEHVRGMLRPYVELVTAAAPVVDVGCGRGEFLDLLDAAGIAASGADMDPSMVEHTRGKGHEVVHADANTFLEGHPDGSLGAVFSSQVIEHIPYEELMRFFRLALRKLRPGGLFIAETMNIHVPTAWKTFWLDLTHQHPILPEVALAQCLLAGYASAYVFYPTATGDLAADRINQSAYAVVARTAA